MTKHLAGFVYARSDSKRLPGKHMYDLSGTRLIDVIFSRIARSKLPMSVLLTTDRLVDDQLAEYCMQQGYDVFRGDAFNLVNRTLQAIDSLNLDGFVRLNGDSPLLEPSFVDESVALLGGDVEFVSNLFNRTFPHGIAVECVSSELYRRLAPLARQPDLEHVTRHLYRLQDRYTRVTLVNSREDLSNIHLTVDTLEDYERVLSYSEKGNITLDSYWELCNIPSPEITFKKERATTGKSLPRESAI